MRDELKYAFRLLRQRPLFAVVAAASIAIGVGATTTIFSVFNSLLLRIPGGIAEPEHAIELGRTNGGRGFDTFSYPELLAMREQSKLLSAVAAFRPMPLSFSAGQGSERIMGIAASAEYFEVFGLKPQLGRFYTRAEDRVPGANPLVVLGDRFWRDRFDADPNVMGRTIDLNRRAFTVIGVAPADFKGHMPVLRTDVYFPFTMFAITRPGFDAWDSRQSSWLTAVARLRPGATLQQVNAELETVFAHFWSDTKIDARERRGATAVAYGAMPGPGRKTAAAFLSLLLAFVVFVLLITCANVAGMLIARAASREKEMAIRVALGSSRGAIVRQLLIESVVLFAIGGTAGVLLARWGADALSSVRLPTPIPVDLDFHADPRVLAFGLGLALLTGLIFGLAPALQASRPSVIEALKSGTLRRGSRGGRLRRGFVMGQVALSLMLLACAGLFLRSLQRAAHIDTGFDAQGVYTVSFDLAIDGYDEPRGLDFQARLLDRLRALPGVTAAGYTEDLPLDLGISEEMVTPEGWKDDRGERFSTAFSRVGGDFFNALRVRVLRGRVFGPQDVATSNRVAVVSRGFAERVWPGQDAIGKRVKGTAGEWQTVIGVVANVKNQSVMETTKPMYYEPSAQNYQSSLNLVVRHAPLVTTAMLRAAIHDVDPRLSLSLIQPLDQYTALGIMPQRIAALLSGMLGLLALLLSAIGVYGVIAFSVTQRTREIGTRMAIGATRADVLRLILRDGLRLTGPGLLIGLLAALALSRVIRSFILGVAPADPLTFSVVPLTLLAIIVIACLAPARRAAGIQPIIALKSE